MSEPRTPDGQKEPEVRRTVVMSQRLWQQAERDIASARMMLQPNGYYVAANLADQAAEKALKAAYWYLRAEEPPWSHDLEKCAERVAEQVGGLPAAVDAALAVLEPMFERSRYPSGRLDEPIPADLIQEDDAQSAIESAEEVMRWVKTLLQRPPGRPQTRRGS